MLIIFFPFLICSFDQSFCEPKIEKYKARKDADLIQVQLLTRHGARTPLHSSKTLRNQWTCLHTEISSIASELSRPLHVANVHGKSIFLGNCQFGQLVDKGHDALTRLGAYIRDVYIDKLKLLPKKFNPKIMYFRSTYSLRTMHSMMALVKNLYPNLTEITIHTADKQYDPWRRTSSLCPRLEEVTESIQKSDEWKKENLDGDPELTSKMKRIFGVKWEHTNDAATSARCEGFELPPNITHKEIDRAVSLKARQRQFILSHESIFPLFFSYSMAEMLNEMIDRINGRSKYRFIYWSAHDGNILAFLGFLGYVDNKWPPYGSFIVTELWKYRENGGKFFLQFRYNGKILKAPRFMNSSDIPFDDFRKFVTKNMPDMVKDCHFNISRFRINDMLQINQY